MTDCKHENPHFDINQQIMEDSSIRYFEIKAKCIDCGAIYKFQCQRIGSSPHDSTVSVDQETISLPALMEGEELTGNAISAIGRFTSLEVKH